jgi:hypothetical protein
MLMATIDGSITLIAWPNIFGGMDINPLQPGNSFYLAAAASWTRGGRAPETTPLFGITPAPGHADGRIEEAQERLGQTVREPARPRPG